MNRTTLFISLLILLSGLNVDAQTFQWAKRIGNPSPATQNVNATATDAAGNVYLTGYFSGTVDFDPNGGTFNLTSNSGSQEIFVCKLSPAGNFLWAKSFSGPMPDWATSITTDASGNVYVTGIFQGTVDFDPGAAVFNMTTAGGPDVFLFKLTNAGNLVWAIKFGSTALDQAKGVAVDASGNVYITGSAGASFDADPGISVFPLNGNYLIKMSSAGNFIWARLIGGMSTCLAVDGSGNIYITGQFSGTVDFDPLGTTVNLTSAGSLDVFVSKFTPAGVLTWARRMGGTGNEMAAGIAADAAGNVHTIGSFDGVSDFDPGTGVYNLTSLAGGMGVDTYISKLSASGTFVWAKFIGGTSGALGRSIDLDASGNVYTTGSFSGTVDFNPGTATNNITASGGETFLSKLNTSGNYVWAYHFSTGTNVNGMSVVIDPWGGIIASGQFSGTGDFNPYSGIANLTSNGTYNIYVLKLYVSPLPIELLTFEAIQNKTAVDITWQTATETNNDFFTIEKSKDGNEFEEIGNADGAGNSTTVLKYSFTDDKPYTGISYYRLKQTDFNGEFSYSKIVAVRITNAENNVVAYPNPFHDKLTVAINSEDNLPYTLILTDLAGRVLLSNEVITEYGFNSYEINAWYLAKGIYLLEVKSQHSSWITKVVLE
jgi:hypothetical protein